MDKQNHTKRLRALIFIRNKVRINGNGTGNMHTVEENKIILFDGESGHDTVLFVQ